MSLSSTKLIELINTHRLSIFRTTDIETLAGYKASAATEALQRLARSMLIKRIKRGVWINALAGSIDPYEALPLLTAPWTSYVSLYSALSDAGVIEEIPHIVYGVTVGRPKRHTTPIGTFHIHHLPERLMWGYEMKRIGQRRFPMAEPEKAFLDLVYLALTPRSSLRLPRKRGRRWALDGKKLKAYALRFKFPPLVKYLKDNRLWE